jgi:hypothetical protein
MLGRALWRGGCKYAVCCLRLPVTIPVACSWHIALLDVHALESTGDITSDMTLTWLLLSSWLSQFTSSCRLCTMTSQNLPDRFQNIQTTDGHQPSKSASCAKVCSNLLSIFASVFCSMSWNSKRAALSLSLRWRFCTRPV